MSRKPDYRLVIRDRETGWTTRAGAAWINESSGSISIRLNPCVRITPDDDVTISLWPADRKETGENEDQEEN